MKRDHIFFAIISGCVLLVGVLVFVSTRSPAEAPLQSVDEIVLELEESSTTEAKVAAAKKFIRHGSAARVEIRKALTSHQDDQPKVVDTLLQATIKTLDYRSMPTLLELLEHPDSYVRGRANAAICKILGADFGFDPNEDPKFQAEVREKIKADYKNSQQRLPEFYSDQLN